MGSRNASKRAQQLTSRVGVVLAAGLVPIAARAELRSGRIGYTGTESAYMAAVPVSEEPRTLIMGEPEGIPASDWLAVIGSREAVRSAGIAPGDGHASQWAGKVVSLEGGEYPYSKLSRTSPGDLAGIASAVIHQPNADVLGEDEARSKIYDPNEHLNAKLLPALPSDVAAVNAHAPLPGAWPLALLGGVLVVKLRRRFA